MQWWQSRRGFGTGLALFALFFQLAVSFAHVHPQDFAAGSPSAVLLPGSPASHADADHSHSRSHDHGNLPPHDDCPVCASIYLATTAIPAQPPLLSTPTAFNIVSASFVSDRDFSIARYLPFQSRAPPIG
jgi:Protein of unknown function (DUF2946)